MRLIVLLSLSILLPTAAAGTAEAPEVTDPAGDAGPNGTAIPAGAEDVDVTAVWFESENLDTIDLVIQTAGDSRQRPNTIWLQNFEANKTAYRAGYVDAMGGVVPMFSFKGMFVCPVEGFPESCIGLDGAPQGRLYRITMPRANLSNPRIGDAITISDGAVLSSSFFGPDVVLWDTTPPGLPYLFAKGAGAAGNATAGAAGAAAGAGGAAGAAANASIRPTETAASEPAATPAPGVLLLLAAAGAAVAWRRRG